LDAHLTSPGGVTQYLGLQAGEAPDESNHQERIDFVAALLGAIAFEMYADPLAHGPDAPNGNAARAQLAPNTVGIPGDRLKGFRTAVAKRLRRVKLWGGTSIANEFSLLGKANNKTVDFLLFQELGKSGLAWHDRTVQAFFAAYWAMNFTAPSDFRVMEQWKGLVNETGERSAEYDEFWQFAAEMPLVDPGRWLRMFQSCYQPPQKLTGKHEWVQWQRRMLYHSYESMKERSPGTIADWQVSYLALAQGTREQRRIYREIEEGLLPIPAGVCPYGADPLADPPQAGIEKEVRAFRLHRWPVTNEMYELFDPGHFAHRWYPGKHPLAAEDEYGDDRCPVVNVTWYDAWCFATWCGDRLPSELEWEHAVRAGSRTSWFFGNDEAELVRYAHYGQHWRSGSTRPVDEQGEAGPARLPNAHRLYDMTGNVWEWCDTWYDAGASARVLRGGCWDYLGRGCRSAFRSGGVPGFRYQLLGFRLAAAPSSLEPGKARPERA
jgi:serine/threonine-protein kinase